MKFEFAGQSGILKLLQLFAAGPQCAVSERERDALGSRRNDLIGRLSIAGWHTNVHALKLWTSRTVSNGPGESRSQLQKTSGPI